MLHVTPSISATAYWKTKCLKNTTFTGYET